MHYLGYHEQRQHGTSQFPIAFYHIDSSHPRYLMPFHWHIEFELIRVLSGKLLLSLEDHSYTLEVGDVAFVLDGVIHGGTPENCIYECLVFDPTPLFSHLEIGSQALSPLLHRLVQVPDFISHEDELSLVAASVMNSARQMDLQNPLILLGRIYEWMGKLCSRGKMIVNAPPPDQKRMLALKPVFEFIEQNYSSDSITLNTLSRLAGMSPKYFCRYFHTATHRTPINYLNFYRIERACSLLSTSTLSISEIAYRCGFSDPTYFIRTFKKFKGTTPKKYLHK